MSEPELWSAAEVADHLGVAKSGVRRQMSRWSITATYERGAGGRPEARYDAEAVRAAQASRPGRGARTDLAEKAACGEGG